MIDFSLMSIDKIIIHHVPNSLKGIPPTFSSRLIQLTPNAISALTTRITDVMGRGSNCIEMSLSDTTDVSAVSQVISIMTDLTDEIYIAKTTSLAQKLFQSQANNKIPPGILVCITGRTGQSQQQFVAVVKAEGQSGFHVTSISDIQFLSDLFLTEAQRLYKIGFFVRSSTNTPITHNDIDTYIFDQNATHNGTVGLATYFSQLFLGCKPLENAAHQTEIFYTSTKGFIMSNTSFSDEKKVELTNSLHSYLKTDQSTVINGQEFANTYFDDPEIIDQYTSRLEEEKLPITAISKDVSRIKNKLKIRRMKFNSGVKITFPSPSPDQKSDDLLVMGSYNKETDYTSIEIKGRIVSQDS